MLLFTCNYFSEILTNSIYKQRASDLSKVSQKYTGHVTACDLTVNLILKNEELDDLVEVHNFDDTDAYSRVKLMSSKFHSRASSSLRALFKYERE